MKYYLLVLFCGFVLPSVRAQTKVYPAIHGYGSVYEVPDALEKPDPAIHYKILVDITDAADKPDSINAYLEAVATLYNLHVVGGVPEKNIDMVVVIHKMATYSILGNEKYRQKFGTDNPNLPLLKTLYDGGVRFFVCGQTMKRAKYSIDQIAPEVKPATSALTTLTTYQLRGYAFINFK